MLVKYSSSMACTTFSHDAINASLIPQKLSRDSGLCSVDMPREIAAIAAEGTTKNSYLAHCMTIHFSDARAGCCRHPNRLRILVSLLFFFAEKSSVVLHSSKVSKKNQLPQYLQSLKMI